MPIYNLVLKNNNINDYSTATLTNIDYGYVKPSSNIASIKPIYTSAILNNGSYYLEGGNNIINSADFITWSASGTTISGMTSVANFAWNTPHIGTPSIQPLTIACGEGSNTLGYSPDGIYWYGLGTDIFNPRANRAVWNGVLWVAVGTGPYWVATSYDGITWQGRNSTLLTEGYDVAWNGSVFIAVGYGGTSPIVASADGINWYSVPSASSIFTTQASSVVWTGKSWIAYGSGTNTTAVSTSQDGWIWAPTTIKNLAITDASSVFYSIGYPQSDTGIATASSYTATYLPYKAFDNSMNLASSTEWRSAAATYNSSTGINTGATTATTYNSSLTASGEWLQINAPFGFVLKHYHISFYVDVSSSYYNIPKEWYLLGSSNGTTWNLLDYNKLTYSAQSPNTYSYPFIVKIRNLSANSSQYSYYRLVIPAIFAGGSTTYCRISEFDLYFENSKSLTLDNHIKPIVTKTHVLHPTTIIPFSSSVGKQVVYQITDLMGNLIAIDSSLNNGFYNTNIISGLKGSPPTGYVFDGQSLIVSSLNGNISYMNNNSVNTNLNFDISMNSTILQSNFSGNLYTSCFNGKQVIFGGRGGNVITYSPPFNLGATSSLYPSLNASQIFSSVNGLASNNDFGVVYCPNRIYFNPGEKISIVAPKAYNKNLQNTNTFNIGLNSSNLIQNLTLPSAAFLFTVFGPTGPIGPKGPGYYGNYGETGQQGEKGIIGPQGIPGPQGPIGGDSGSIGTIGYTGATGHIGQIDNQLWNYVGSSQNITTTGNVQIGTLTQTHILDVSGNLNVTNTLKMQRSHISQGISITKNLTIGKSHTLGTTNKLDVSGNVVLNSNIVKINSPTMIHSSQNLYSLDISGNAKFKYLFAKSVYNYMAIPMDISATNITINYKSSDIFYIDVGATITQNFYCNIQNLPLLSIPFSGITITLLLDYVNTGGDRFYCDKLRINETEYTPNFNGGNPVAISEFNASTNSYLITYAYIQRFTILVTNGTIWKIFCESEKYSS